MSNSPSLSTGLDKTTIENYFSGDYLKFYSRFLLDIKPGGNGQAMVLCPFHEDRTPSLSINLENGQFHCFGCEAEGDIFSFYGKLHNMTLPVDFSKVIAGIAKDFNIHNGNESKQTIKPTVTARYDYQDECRKLIYQIERLEPKSFRIRRPDGNGGWIYKKDDVSIIPYRLPQILKTADFSDQILIVEGEKDADALEKLGFIATCNPFGAGKWPSDFAQYFKDKIIIIIPDNDEPGRAHAKQVYQNLKKDAWEVRLLELPDIPEKEDVSYFIASFKDKTLAANRLTTLIKDAPLYPEDVTEEKANTLQDSIEDAHTMDEDDNHEGRLAKLREFLQQDLENTELRAILQEIREIKLIQNSQNVSEWLLETPDAPDQILVDTFDTRDKIAIIGSSKMKKSFFMLMLLICIAAGRDFLRWRVPKPRRVVLIQLEIQAAHFHKRVLNITRSMGINPKDLGDRFHVINCRGLGVEGQEGIDLIGRVVESYKPEVISFDPLYKIAIGAENAIEDAKLILNSFDALIEKTGAAIAYVHHDAKGQSGDRDIRDRGAGSNVISRDYDACITLTPHVSDVDATVVEAMIRNYRPQDPFTALWVTDEKTGGYRFDISEEIAPTKKTSRTRTQAPSLSTYFDTARKILDHELEIAVFKETFKKQTGLANNRIDDFISWATAGGNPILTTREERGKGKHKKWIQVSKGAGDE
jgi:5S rRNA maturation endonuclease (ribonuclease M5)